MADTLLVPVVATVAGKAADELVQSVARTWAVDADRGRLERTLLAVQRVLPDAEAKGESSPVVRMWMRELKAVAYRADDVLDDLQHEALRREASEREPEPPMACKPTRRYLTLRNPLLLRRLTVSRSLRKVLKELNGLVLETRALGLAERPAARHRHAHAPCQQVRVALNGGSAEIFGRDGDRDEVVKLLLDQRHHQDQKNVQVLPVVGAGGVGKTTLARMVYTDRRVQKHFELRMWHCVSGNFGAASVVRSVVELATGERCDLPDAGRFWRARLQQVVGRKRFLLVLDDVRDDEEREKWEGELKPLLCTCIGGSGSVILVTTRSQQVSAVMGSLPSKELARLTEEDSWEFFSKKAFSRGVQERPELVAIGRRIVHVCKGLPLALSTMGGLMSSKQEAQDWEAIAESCSSDTDTSTGSGTDDEVLSMLKLSYGHLPDEMKQCFAFCAVFPKDHEMEKDRLIQLWMANGYVGGEGTVDLAQKSESVFSELVWRSFLQDVEGKVFCNSLHETVICRMHGLMHDLAKDVSDECASSEELVRGKAAMEDVYHLRVSCHELNGINGLLKGTPSLHTLLLTQSEHEHDHLKELKLKSVRSLCCEGLSAIHGHQLINTAHLRYLDLSRSKIVSLPDSLCALHNLQSLWLNGCSRLRYLPDCMSAMRKISYIHLLECDSLERMPPKLGRLQNLHTLTTFIVDTEDGLGIDELRDLRHLGNRLELFNLSKVKDDGSEAANLHEKRNLSELVLYWGRDRDYDPLDNEACDEDEGVLESLVPHGELKVLKLHGYGGLAVSKWMRDSRMFQCLRELVVTECPRCKDLPVVWLSPSLEVLELSGMIGLTTLCTNVDVAEAAGRSASRQIFPKLRRMRLQYLPELERWTDQDSAGEPAGASVMFPMLEELRVYECYKLASFPASPALTLLSCRGDSGRCLVPVSMPMGSWPSLVHLDIGLLAEVVMPVEDTQSQNQRHLNTMRSVKVLGEDGFVSVFNLSKSQLGFRGCLALVEKLEIGSCPSVVHWPVEELRCLPRLRSLDVWYCKNLEGKGASSEETLPLPQLEWLSIQHCESLLEIPRLPTSLEQMAVRCCSSLVALPSNLGSLAKLGHLCVDDCGEMKALPDGMDGLASLESLSVEECPGVEMFPQGLLQRLPALKFLEIKACPGLQRRCRQGGEYFGLVSSISNIDIPAVESNVKKFVKKLIPFC
jgi:hypothetical protein